MRKYKSSIDCVFKYKLIVILIELNLNRHQFDTPNHDLINLNLN